MTPAPCQLVLHPAPVLREKARPVEVFDESLAELVAEMCRLMKEHEGVGLAAPQAGHSLQVFVCNSGAEGESDQVFINPEILEADGPPEWMEEGCLSLPGIRGRVRRPTRVRIRARDLEGKTFELESDAFPARIWQHEFDHLHGVLILDRMRPIDRIAIRRALKDLVDRSAPE
ncbi:MAG: peptide deformylase [Planctomycetota bacterium]|nr:peptide deformylase [Planctomycetota bacterium]